MAWDFHWEGRPGLQNTNLFFFYLKQSPCQLVMVVVVMVDNSKKDKKKIFKCTNEAKDQSFPTHDQLSL